jgi:hypothetical protein
MTRHQLVNLALVILGRFIVDHWAEVIWICRVRRLQVQEVSVVVDTTLQHRDDLVEGRAPHLVVKELVLLELCIVLHPLLSDKFLVG